MYIRTESGENINSLNYELPYVRPLKDGGWVLLMNPKPGKSSSTITIAEFKTVNQANQALDSLKTTDGAKGWDANEYKEHLSKSPMELAGYTS